MIADERSTGQKKIYRIASSPWLPLCLLAIGWVPLFVLELGRTVNPHPGGNSDYWVGLGLARGLTITLPLSVLGLAWGAGLIVRALFFGVSTRERCNEPSRNKPSG